MAAKEPEKKNQDNSKREEKQQTHEINVNPKISYLFSDSTKVYSTVVKIVVPWIIDEIRSAKAGTSVKY